MSTIMVVCTGNICRSPVGKAALTSHLPENVTVTSAGTHAAVGRPAAPETSEFVARELGIKLDHAAQQLTRQQAEAADLVITMTTEQRAWVARTAPRAVRRTYTLKELHLLLNALPPESPFTSLKELAQAVSRLRPRLAQVLTGVDIADPYGGPPEGYETAFAEVLHSSRRVAHEISPHLANI